MLDMGRVPMGDPRPPLYPTTGGGQEQLYSQWVGIYSPTQCPQNDFSGAGIYVSRAKLLTALDRNPLNSTGANIKGPCNLSDASALGQSATNSCFSRFRYSGAA